MKVNNNNKKKIEKEISVISIFSSKNNSPKLLTDEITTSIN